jgi:LmbE family N-acetylglucosaminyl deacetylase
MTSIKKLIIVAHPDDETIWASDLLDENTFVLVICGKNRYNYLLTQKRKEEFEQVMSVTKSSYKICDFPDKQHRWGIIEQEIIKKIIYTISLFPLLENIYTHNEYGEYGHQDHVRIHYLVKNLYVNKQIGNINLFVFWPNFNYDKIQIPTNVEESCNFAQGILKNVKNKNVQQIEAIELRVKLLNIYKSQTVEMFKTIMIGVKQI